MFENPRRGRQARNFTTNVPKILDLKSSSEQIFLENWHWVPLITSTLCVKNILPFLNGFGIHLNGSGYPFKKNFQPFERLGLSVRKKLSSVWTACAIRSKKNVIHLNGLGRLCLEKIVMAWRTLLVYTGVTPCLMHDSCSRKGTVFVPKHGKKTCKGTD